MILSLGFAFLSLYLLLWTICLNCARREMAEQQALAERELERPPIPIIHFSDGWRVIERGGVMQTVAISETWVPEHAHEEWL